LSGMIARGGKFVGAAAVVVLRQGFAGAAMRAVVSSVLLATRPPFPAKVLGSAGEAARWLAMTFTARGAINPKTLETTADRLRAELGKAPVK